MEPDERYERLRVSFVPIIVSIYHLLGIEWKAFTIHPSPPTEDVDIFLALVQSRKRAKGEKIISISIECSSLRGLMAADQIFAPLSRRWKTRLEPQEKSRSEPLLMMSTEKSFPIDFHKNTSGNCESKSSLLASSSATNTGLDAHVFVSLLCFARYKN